MKKISIIITCYNKERFIARAIRSSLNVLKKGFTVKVVVVNDGSTDESDSVIKRFSEKITYINLEENIGVAGASNKGLSAVKSDYWMRVDGDDFISQDALIHMFPILNQNSEYSFVYANHVRVDEISAVTKYVDLKERETLFNHGAGVLFRSCIFDNEYVYDERFRNAEDYKLLKLLIDKNHKGFHLPLYLYRYYIHGDNLTLNENRQTYIEKAKHST